MKKIRFLTLYLLLGASLALSSCSDGQMHLHGHMETIDYLGQKCWIFIDDNHDSYEVITPSPQVLREDLQMRIKAVKVERKTLCDLPTVIDIIEFRPDYDKDM